MKLRQSAIYVAIALLAACNRTDPATLVGSAKDHMAKQEFSAAIIQLKNALQKDPQNGEARYLFGLAALENGDLASAETELNKARQLGYENDALQVALARNMLARGEYKKLVDEFDGTKLSSPKLQAELLATVGAGELALNRRSEAQAAFREALALDASSSAANLGLARLAVASRDFPGALSLVDAALTSSPSSAEALLLKADLLAVQGEPEAAEKAYREAVTAPNYHVAARVALIGHLIRTRNLDKAAAEVSALEKAAPKDPRTAYARAWLLSEQGQYAGAREAIQQVLKVAPDHVPSLMIAGISAAATRAYPEAESHFRKVLQKAPEWIMAKRLLAATHLRMGQAELALTEAKELLNRAPEDASVLVLAGEAYLANGDAAGAARQYEKAKALAPNNVNVQTRLALVRFASGEADRGVKELEASSASHPEDYQADLALIATYLRQRQADKALQAVQALEKKQPDNPLTDNLRGLALVLKRDRAGARASFEHALKLQPSYMPAVTNLAQLDLADKKPEAARKRYEAIVKKEPNNEQALAGLAVLLRITGAPKEEIEKVLKQAVAGNPGSPNTRIALINFHLGNRDYAKALAAAQEAQASLPNDAAITELLGTTQLLGGEPRQAVAAFQKLTEMAPKAPQALVELARAQIAAKQPDDAIKSLRAALVLRPELGGVEHEIAGIYVKTGRYDQALAEARSVQKERPDEPLGYALEGEVYIAQKKLDAAERTYRAALKKFDLPALAARSHAVMTAGGKAAEADAMAEKWISAHPKDTSVLVYLAQLDLGAKRYPEAAKRYQTALQRQPDNALLLNNLAWVSGQLKQPKALEYAERANELAPENPAILDTLGWILAQNGQTERALQLLGRAVDLAPQAHGIRLNFAKALIKADRKAAARKELESLAKLDPNQPVQKEASALLTGL
ncbi:MAG TPA: XrtA/PEP-CTERM system TPR-repeat protein PrsT [Burkholderiales bacterium]|nr:XrtA/PEP-CTERM system TPR-repeat protein PrsT [Burkholderiales bacterium]